MSSSVSVSHGHILATSHHSPLPNKPWTVITLEGHTIFSSQRPFLPLSLAYHLPPKEDQVASLLSSFLVLPHASQQSSHRVYISSWYRFPRYPHTAQCSVCVHLKEGIPQSLAQCQVHKRHSKTYLSFVDYGIDV